MCEQNCLKAVIFNLIRLTTLKCRGKKGRRVYHDESAAEVFSVMLGCNRELHSWIFKYTPPLIDHMVYVRHVTSLESLK